MAISTLKTFWENPDHADAKQALLAWCQIVKNANWLSPADLKSDLRSVSILQDVRAIFNIAGNKYRLVVWINYQYKTIYIRFIGTHGEYDAIDPQKI